jgi:hypothetical protein
MKAILTVFAAFGLMVGAANQPGPPPDESMEARTARRMSEISVELRLDRPNEVTVRNFTLDGISVQALRTDNPWQLINPLAPPEYGYGEDNVARDPINGKASGLKVFSIKF